VIFADFPKKSFSTPTPVINNWQGSATHFNGSGAFRSVTAAEAVFCL
jgi:hypothetical protein